MPEADSAPGEETQSENSIFIQKPESATATKGADVTFVARVDSSRLPRKPALKWFKGKWLDLGSKAGKHLQFKEVYDRNTKIYTFEMKLVKVVDGDAGGYRCEVSAKDKADCCYFDIAVQAVQEDHEDNILEAFKRSGGADEDAGALDFSGLLKKREKKQRDKSEGEEVDVWDILKKAKPCDYEKIAFQYGITDFTGMLKMLKAMKKVEVTKSDAFLRKMESAYSVDKGKKITMSVEVADGNANVRWLKNGQEIKPSAKYVMESVGNVRTLTINKCNLSDDAAYECVVDEEKSFTELFVKEPPVTITKLLDDVHTVVSEKVEFEVEVSEEGANVKWMKGGEELNKETAGSKYRFKKDGKRHILVINEATLEDIGTYHAITNGGESKAELEVEDAELQVLQSIADLTVKSAEQAVFKCEVSDEKVTGKWFKDGVEVQPGDRVKISHIGRMHKLTINDVKQGDAGDYTFVPDGHALSLSAKLNFLEIKIDYKPRQDPPKIHLDTGSGNKNGITVVAGNKLRLDVEVSGEPAPTVIWKRGDEEVAQSEGRVHVEMTKGLCSFVIESAERSDEGPYSITVSNPAGEDHTELLVKVVDVPEPPENVRCSSVGEDSAVITWDAPPYDGGIPLKGYLMERKKVGSARWTKLNFDVFESTTYEAKRMIDGVLYEMRVFAVNGIGVSQPSDSSKPFMPLAPTSEPTRLQVDDLTDSTCALKWRQPEKVGAGGIQGYIIEYCVEGSDQWVQANEAPVEKTQYRVKGLPVGEKMLFRVVAVNPAGRSPPAVLGQAVTIREIVESPKIRVPRHLRSKLITRVGEKVNIVIPFQGKPRPVVTWSKDGTPLDVRSVGIRTSDVDSILFIRSSERVHSGVYTLHVQIENMSDSADIHIQVVDRPGPPVLVRVADVWGFNAALEWKPPKDDGNCDILGYMIQKADLKTKEWFTVYDHNRRPSCTVSDLVMGNEYSFRVFSENVCGLSDEPGVAKNTAVISKSGLEFNPRPFQEMDMSRSPKFTAPLVDRSVVAGYTTAISCAVRGFPRPKIVWMKNNMIISEDPKFLMQNNQGVLTLRIRKPSLFDGGRYVCRAINDLGQDEVECKLVVRVAQEKEEVKAK
ncbi:myosin-binding protein C, fast-type-like [Eucyclogobius newberryi]|uniref:myosin-binding protein C, fast-type-like n=1 Tax=Eucyclogobius newberryi TaxID=166745 RepID=UPI003B5BD9D0